MEEKDFQTFHSFDPGDEKEELTPSLSTLSSPTTPCTPNPCTPIMPNTPSTPGLTVNEETDQSQFSLSMDSGIESPQGLMLTGSRIQAMVNNHAKATNQSGSRQKPGTQSVKAAEHTNKEKMRRERIKDSCDQLRVLLPYVRGRKTDMASILEMCVEYLRIVNAFMPQTLQQQIVDILSKETAVVVTGKGGKENKASVKQKAKKEEMNMANSSPPSTANFVDKNANFTLTGADSLSPCGLHSDFIDNKGTKRIHLQDSVVRPGHFDDRAEHSNTGQSDVTPGYSFHSNQVGGLHLDDQSFGRLYTDGYSTAQQIFNNYTNNKSLEPDYLRPTYFDPFQFYPGVLGNNNTQSRGSYSTMPEYVNPNVVLQTIPHSSMIVKTISSSGKMDSFTSVNGLDQQKVEKSP